MVIRSNCRVYNIVNTFLFWLPVFIGRIRADPFWRCLIYFLASQTCKLKQGVVRLRWTCLCRLLAVQWTVWSDSTNYTERNVYCLTCASGHGKIFDIIKVQNQSLYIQPCILCRKEKERKKRKMKKQKEKEYATIIKIKMMLYYFKYNNNNIKN